MRALEESYRQPGAQQRALKTKEQDIKRFKVLLKRAGGPQVHQNQRQGAFDELQRTPTKTLGKAQTKHVAGGPQLPGQDLRPGKDRYAQPDYSVVRRRRDGTLERVHVNLKSDQIDMRTPAKARATARAYVAQAIRNSRHLASGEKIIISFAHTPNKDVQEEMKREFFKAGSPVGEVRFGTTTHKRENYKPPATQPAGPKATPSPKQKKTGSKPAKKTATRLTKQTASKTKPKTPKVQPPRAKKRKAATPKVADPRGTAPKVTTSTALKVAQPKVTTSALKVAPPKTTTPRVTAPRVSTPRVTTHKVTARPPRIPLRAGLGGGGMMRGDRAGAAAAVVGAIAVPIIMHYMRKHFAAKWEAEQQALISGAIEARRGDYETLIEARRGEIEYAQSQGREVTLRIAVDTNWQDTDLGPALTKAKVGDYQLVFEDEPPPRAYKRSKPGGRVGSLVRGYTGTELTFETFNIPLEGTDPEARARRRSRETIGATLQATAGLPFAGAEMPFELLIIDALTNNRPLDPLRDYAVFRTERAVEAGVPPKVAGLAYWVDMVELMDGTLDQLIAAAKAKKIPLGNLRAVAAQRREQAGQASDAGAGPAAAAYWGEIVRLIDAD